jgi:cellulose synthase/poly-beta-1,6-N-acetylglucosamine synthase-like glycosyltransferase
MQHSQRHVGAVPQHDTQYFFPIQHQPAKVIAVVVPFYNEEWKALTNTLRTLHRCEEYIGVQLGTEYRFAYLLIQDGWAHASISMRQGLQRMFPNNPLWNEVNCLTNDKEEAATYIFQTIANNNGQQPRCAPTTVSTDDEDQEDQDLELNLALVIKKDNRKKHNSHQWFFSADGYCGNIGAEFCFATDCATMFDERCLYHLVRVMEKTPSCVVCTGRQVVMTKEMQGSEGGFLEWIYRGAQCFDFESSFASFVGAFATVGFLPVVPGPCGLYRWSLMNGEPLKWYFEQVNKPAELCGLVHSNLKIAEDRILTYSAVLKTDQETRMCLHPDAEFYFEAETSLGTFASKGSKILFNTYYTIHLNSRSKYSIVFCWSRIYV